MTSQQELRGLNHLSDYVPVLFIFDFQEGTTMFSSHRSFYYKHMRALIIKTKLKDLAVWYLHSLKLQFILSRYPNEVSVK